MTHFLIHDLTRTFARGLEGSAWAGSYSQYNLSHRFPTRGFPTAFWTPRFTLRLFANGQLVNKLGERGHSTATSPSDPLLIPVIPYFGWVGHLGLFGVITQQRLPPLERINSLERLNMTSWRYTFHS